MTLAVSQKLAALIDREPGMRAVLTRRGDYFVDLNKRSEIARKAKADLLVYGMGEAAIAAAAATPAPTTSRSK